MTDRRARRDHDRRMRETDRSLTRPLLVARALTLAVTVALVAAALVVIG
jgi:hypothetical protein